MTDVNPYTSPDAALDTGSTELYEPSIFTFNGRIGRMRYLAYGLGAMFIMSLAMIPLMGVMFAGGDSMGALGILGVGLFSIAAVVVSIMFAKRRLNDLNRSGWWILLFIVPVVSFLLTIYMMAFPGTDGDNDFGPAPVANSVGVLILGWLFIVFMALGIVSAIAMPALVGTMPQ